MGHFSLILVAFAIMSSFVRLEGAPGNSGAENAVYNITSPEHFMAAIASGINHIRLTAHLDLRNLDSSVPDAGVLVAAASTLQSITGRCGAAAPVVHSHPPVGQLQPGQCLIQVSTGFLGWFEKAAANVWLDNLYIRSPMHQPRNEGKVHDILLHWRPQQPAALWLTNVTLQGGKTGLFVNAASVFAQDVRFRNVDPGLAAWAGADVSMLACSWRRAADSYRGLDFSVEAEKGEDTRLRLEQCTLSQRFFSDNGISADAVVFTDDEYSETRYHDLDKVVFPLFAGHFDADSYVDYAYGPWAAAAPHDGGIEVDHDDSVEDQDLEDGDGDGDSDIVELDLSPASAASRSANSSIAGTAESVTAGGHRRAHVPAAALLHMPRNATPDLKKARADLVEKIRQAHDRVDALRARFLSADDAAFQKLRSAVKGGQVKAYIIPDNLRELRPEAGGWPPLPGGDSDRTLLILTGVILALLLALALALGCVIGLCTARTLPAPRDRDTWRAQQQAADDERSTEVVRGAGGAGDATKQRRRRGGDEAVLLPRQDSDDVSK